jgi:hypothetical protein
MLYIDEVLDVLRANPAIHSIRVIRYRETPQGQIELKIR